MSNRLRISFSARNSSQWLSAGVAATVFVCGLLWQSASLLGFGAVALCIVLRQFNSNALTQSPAPRRREPAKPSRQEQDDGEQPSPERQPILEQLQTSSAPHSTDALVDELLATNRYALLLRPETKQHLTQM